MTVYYSGYSNPNTSGTLGTSLVDLTSTSFADLIANAATYNGGVEYKKGTIVYNQNSSWVYINNTPTTGNAPPILPTISNAYWELLGTNGTFTWIAYANSTNGTTFTDFTTGAYDSGGIIRKWIGISPNKTTGTESTNTADYSWTKIVGEDGAAGSTSATISIYRRSATAPTLPSAVTTYTFSTSTLTGLNNGWTTTVPAGSDPLYVAAATAFSTTGSDTIQPNEWSSPVILVQNGANGSNGLSVATVFLYQRTATSSAPSVSTSGTATYTFSTGAITGQPSGWTTAVPSSGGGFLWVIQATASNTTATDSIANTEWSTPVLLAQDGTNGSPGTNGTRTAVLEMYQWASSPPSSFPSGTSTYTWSTGAFTAPATANSWTLTPGTPSAGQTLYVVRQIYSDTLTTATSTVTWAATSSLPSGAAGTNGSNGVNGQRVGVLEVYRWSVTSPTVYPSGTSTYTWATGVYTPPSTANGWALVPGSSTPGQTLWAISVSVSDNLTTSTSTATWNSTTPFAVGYAGINGTNGVDGVRGSKEFFASGSSWSDATAEAAITATGLTKVLLDQVTISNGTNFAETRFWNGSAWTTITQVINGNLLVNGTVGANALVAGTVLANVFNVGSTKFKLDGSAKGAGKGSLIVTDGTNDILTVGHLDSNNIGLSLKDTSGNIVMQTSTPAGGGTSTNSFAPAISNGAITVDIAGTIQGIGSGSGTTVANNQIAINGSGQITGIGTGASTTVANNQIAINGTGQITGIGTGANTTVANSQITISGGQISGIGTGNNSYVVKNLQDASTWMPGAAPPWGLNGNANENSIVWGTGPKGGTIPLWKCTSSGDGEADGGWNYPSSFRVDKNKTYRFMLPFRMEVITGTSGSVYLGIDGNSVCDLNTSTKNSNPYFHAVGRTAFTINRWYLMVGFIYPAGSTGASNTGAHIYDMTTGAIVSNGVNYCWASDVILSGTRAYLYYATTAGNIQYFAGPVVELVDGSESSINELLQASAIYNQSISISSGAIQGIGTGNGTTVANSSITVDGSGILQGVGTANTVVANNQIAINGSGQLTGIGSGVNTTVANNQITVNGSGQLTGIGSGVNTTVANNQITVSGGAISGIGAGSGTLIDNNFTFIGQNILPNSDAAQYEDWQIQYNPNGANISAGPTLAKFGGYGWTTSNYVLAGTETNNIFVYQSGIATGTVDGSGDGAVACDIYPYEAGNMISMPALPNEQFIASAYLANHRCRAGVFLGFFNAAGTALLYQMSSSVGPTDGNANTLSSYIRAHVKATAPANTAYVRLFIRKFNTLAGQADSWLWWAAPQLERVNSGVTTPSPYQPGQVSSTRQLGYSGTLDANTTSVDGVGRIQGVSSGAGTTIANNQITVSGGAISGIGTGSGTMIANNAITIDASGILQGAGTANVTIANNQITVNGSGQLTGIGSGVNTTVANNQITVNGSGQLTGIGSGVNTTVANNQITVSGGAINGIGTGSGTVVANSSITIDGSGILQGVGTANIPVANSQVPLGQNLAINSDFINSTTGWAPAWDGNTGGTIIRGVNLPNWWGQLNVLFAYRQGTPSAGTVFDAFITDAPGGLEGYRRFAIPVIPGDRLYFSWLLGTHRCSGYAIIGFYDGSGNYISENGGSMVAENFGASNGNPSTMGRSEAFATAPANARYARLWARAVVSGATEPYLFCAQPFVTKVSASQVASPVYSSGPADRAATLGATIGSNLAGIFTEAEFNNRFNTNIISGVYMKDATLGTAKIADAAITNAKILDGAILNAKIGNLEVDSAKIANLTIGTQKITDLAVSRSSSSFFNFAGWSYPTNYIWYDVVTTISNYVFVGTNNGSYDYEYVFAWPQGGYDYVFKGPGQGDYNLVTTNAGLITSVATGSSSESGSQVVNIEAVVVIERDGGSDDNVGARVVRTNDNAVMPESYSTLRARSGKSTYAMMFRDPSPIPGTTNTYKVQLYNNNDDSHIYEAGMRATLFRK